MSVAAHDREGREGDRDRRVVLEAEGVHAAYGPSRVLHGVSVHVSEGETVCLLGRNGAGKTTTLRSVMGVLPPTAGRVRILDRDVAGWSSHRIARLGVGYVPEDRRIFPTLTVTENLELARAASRGRDGADLDAVLDLFPTLRRLLGSRGSALSGGEQQMLAIARALMTAPRILLLDEPAEGLAPVIIEDLQAILRRMSEAGNTILLAEQNVAFVLDIAHRAYILDRGEIHYEGTTAELREDDETLNRYLAVG